MRLRYATVLFEETDNLEQAEDALNKGVRAHLKISGE